MTATKPPVEFRDVHVAFGRNRVFSGLNLRVERGEILTLLGGSGCGKSVLLKLILGLVPWQRGEVQIDGEALALDDEVQLLAVRRKIGMVFQWGALFDSLDVFDNIAYPLLERGIRDPAVLRRRVADVLARVGLPGIERQMPAELSGGMRKRVALARAVAEEPTVLLYDEPTTGLDPMNVRRISELIATLRGSLDVTSIVVTHDLPSACMISDRIAMVADRRIIAVDTPERMRTSNEPAVREFFEAMPLAEQTGHIGPSPVTTEQAAHGRADALIEGAKQ